MNNTIPSVLLIAFGFFLGNIHFCYILPKKFLDKDICELSDDHNPGASNVFTYCGISMGIVCLILDISKGIIPILLAKKSINPSDFVFGAIMAAPVLGHAVGIFRNFHGGKCIATSFGVLIGILPMAFPLLTLASLYILFSTVLKIHPAPIPDLMDRKKCGIMEWIYTQTKTQEEIHVNQKRNNTAPL